MRSVSSKNVAAKRRLRSGWWGSWGGWRGRRWRDRKTEEGCRANCAHYSQMPLPFLTCALTSSASLSSSFFPIHLCFIWFNRAQKKAERERRAKERAARRQDQKSSPTIESTQEMSTTDTASISPAPGEMGSRRSNTNRARQHISFLILSICWLPQELSFIIYRCTPIITAHALMITLRTHTLFLAPFPFFT